VSLLVCGQLRPQAADLTIQAFDLVAQLGNCVLAVSPDRKDHHCKHNDKESFHRTIGRNYSGFAAEGRELFSGLVHARGWGGLRVSLQMPTATASTPKP
jgi:hypothetical protein